MRVFVSKNNTFYYTLGIKETEFTSQSYTSKKECLKAMISHFEKERRVYWCQLVIHHHADKWMPEAREVQLTLTRQDNL